MRSILEELESLRLNKDKTSLVENRAAHVIQGAINLLTYIKENYSEEISEELKKESREISYAAEIYEFLLFQLTKDIESDYKELADALRKVKPDVSEVEPVPAS